MPGAHVDAVTRALRQVDDKHRAALAAIVDGLVGEARSLPAHEFERRLKVEVRRLQGDDDKQQKKSIRWRSWVERISGMFRGDFACDPLSAVKIDKRIQDEIDRLFAERAPDDCPDDPIEKQKYLAGLAVISLLLGNGGGVGKPELIVVVDATQVDADGNPTVDWGLPVDLPPKVLRDVAARAKLHIVAVWPPADLDLGRSQRLASAAQRRVLRALYPSCAIPGCGVRFSSHEDASRLVVGARRPHRPRQPRPDLQSAPPLRARPRLEAQAPARPHPGDHLPRRRDHGNRPTEPRRHDRPH